MMSLRKNVILRSAHRARLEGRTMRIPHISAPTDCPILSGMMCLVDRKAGMRLGAIFGGVTAVLAAMCASGAPAYAASPAPLADPVKARLVPELGAVAPGGTLWVDLHLDIAPGW